MTNTSPAATTIFDFPGIAGRLLTPDHAEYPPARVVVYGGIDTRPAAIVKVANTDDVVKSIAYARGRGLELAIRSGGHSAAGHSSTEGGIVIDLRDLDGIDIDAAGRTAWVGAGATAVEFLAALAPHKLVVGFGDAGTVGVSGITLGGGVGYLSRKLGLTVDAVLAFELVTAAGEVIVADADSHPDLFWALRGGGGNFGAVTRIRYRLSPLEHFTGGMLMLPATAETVAAFVAASQAAGEDMSTICNVMPAPPMPFLPADQVGKMVIMGMLAYSGPASGADAAIAPFRAIATPLADFVQSGEYHAIMFPPEDGDYHPTATSLNLFMDRFGPAEAELAMDYLARGEAPFRVIQLRVLGGAASRVAADATAYAHRDRNIMVNVAAFHDGSAADRASKHSWVANFAHALNGTDRAAYVNFIGDEGSERVRDAYLEATWNRLRQVKRQYDPHNLFRRNQNIPPA
jgi:FAD/FMN-containing dehydrogenase